MAKPIGTPCPSVSRLRLAPFFPPIRGVTAGILTTQGRFCHRSVQAQPIPLDPFQFVKPLNSTFPQLQENIPFNPFLKAIVGSRARTQVGLIQRFPLACGSHHIEDPICTFAIWNPRPPTSKPMGVYMDWQDGL
jgi:hypothetical protein